MLNITCTYCRAPINLNDGELALIMQELDNTGRQAGGKRPKSAPVPCPTCRRINKVPAQRLQQAYRLAGSPPAPTPVPAESSPAPE